MWVRISPMLHSSMDIMRCLLLVGTQSDLHTWERVSREKQIVHIYEDTTLVLISDLNVYMHNEICVNCDVDIFHTIQSTEHSHFTSTRRYPSSSQPFPYSHTSLLLPSPNHFAFHPPFCLLLSPTPHTPPLTPHPSCPTPHPTPHTPPLMSHPSLPTPRTPPQSLDFSRQI